MTENTPALVEPPAALTRYERAVYWLGEAVRVPEVMAIRSEAEQLRLLGKQASDKSLQADAVELQMRAERRLGELLIRAKEMGQIGRGAGHQARNQAKRSDGEHMAPVRLEDVGIDRKLSMKAQNLAKSPGPLFEDVVRSSREKILAGRAIVINPLRDISTAEKKVRRQIKEMQLAKRQAALPEKRFGVILEDPEWQFEPYSRESGMDRAADNHYPTSTTAVIAARPVDRLAAEDSAYFLWATVPMLLDAIEVMKARGFTYKSHWIWDKVTPGTGYWNRNQHEVLLLGTRGTVPAPAPGTQWPSVISAPATAHSEKPEWAYELIEAYFPNLSRIELNARKARPGWDRWGNEAPEHELAGEAAAAPPDAMAGEVVGPSASPAPYLALVAADALKGRHSRDTARPILEAAYACRPIVPIQVVADDLGHKKNTVLSWARRLGLSDISRRTENGHAAKARGQLLQSERRLAERVAADIQQEANR